jgi:single-strand DNA-binding protein
MLNHITIMGRLTAAPELRRTGSGVAVASFTIACDRDFGGNGEKETDFVDIVAWRNTAEFVSKYFSKGRMAVVSGRLQIRNWNDKDGNKRKTAEIVADNVYFGDSKNDNGNQNSGFTGFVKAENVPGNNGGFGSFAPIEEPDVGLPF